MKFLLKIACCLAITVFQTAQAGEQPMHDKGSQPVEVWVNPGFYSYHFERNKGFQDNNYGTGIQVTFSPTNSILAGGFRNSDNAYSRYAGWAWQPLELSAVKLGLAAGVIDGYPRMRNGKPFLAVIPMASIEYKAIGANITLIPRYKDKLHGAISIQVKLRIW